MGAGYRMLSYGGNYTQDGLKKGMNENQASMYGETMAGMETLMDTLGDKLKGVAIGKAKTVPGFKNFVKTGLKELGVNATVEGLGEAVTEPIQELVATAFGGKADYDNIGERMWQSFLGGFASEALMTGASLGYGGSINAYNKIRNGEEITLDELKGALKEIDQKDEVDLEKMLVNNFNFTADELYRNTDVQQNREEKLGKIAEELSNEEKRQIMINESDLDDDQKEVLSEIATQFNLSDKDVKKAIENTKQGKYTQNNEVLQEGQQTIQEGQKVAQNETSQEQRDLIQDLQKFNETRQEGQEIFDLDNEENVKEVQAIQKVAEKRGINITFDESRFDNTDTNAFYEYDKDNNVANIVLNPNSTSKKYVQNLVIHEMAHSFEGNKEYNSLSKAILDFAKSKGEYDKAFNDLMNTYSKVYSGENLNKIVEKEAVANILGEKLGDKQFVDSLVNNQYIERNIIQKIIDFAKNQINRFKGYKDQEAYWNHVKTLFEDAYNKSKVSQEGLKASVERNKLTDTRDSQGRQLSEGQVEYFKDSKVRDGNGNLIPMYHSTSADFTIFDKEKLGDNTFYANTPFGFFVTSNKAFSERFKDIDNEGKQGKTMEVYIDAKKPITHPYNASYKYSGEELDRITREWLEATDEAEGLKELETMVEEGDSESLWDAYMELMFSEDPYEIAEDERKILESKGYDAVEFVEGDERTVIEESGSNEPVTSYAVFNSNQIKNIDNTNPTNNPDIRYSVETEQFDKILEEKFSNPATHDNNGLKLTKGMENFMKNSKARDLNNGGLVNVFHTTGDNAFIEQFNEFDPRGDSHYKFGNQIVNYYTDNKNMSSSYGNKKEIKADTRKLKTLKDVENYAKENDLTITQNTDGSYNVVDASEQARYDKMLEYINNNLSKEELQTIFKINKQGKEDIQKFTLTPLTEYEQQIADKRRKLMDDIRQNYLEFMMLDEMLMGEELSERPEVEELATFKDKKDLLRNLISKTQGEGIWQYSGYVNIQNPYVIDAKGENWNRIPTQINEYGQKLSNAIDVLEENNLYVPLKKLYDKTINDSRELADKFMRIQKKANNEQYQALTYLGISGNLDNLINSDLYTQAEKNKIINSINTYIDGKSIQEIGLDYYNNKFTTLWEKKANEFLEQNPMLKGLTKEDLSVLAENYGGGKAYIEDRYTNKEKTNEIVQRIIDYNNSLFGEEKADSTHNSVIWADIYNNKVNKTPEEILAKGGYDGVIIRNVTDYGHDVGDMTPGDLYITFGSNQFKAQDNKKPTNDPDIRYSKDTTGAWNNFIEKYFKNEGEGTAIKDLKKLPTREYTIQDYEEVINNSANIPEADKKSILKDLEGIELNKQSLNDFKQYVNDLDKNYAEYNQTQEQQRFENKNYKDEGRAELISNKRKEFNKSMEYDDSVVAELDEIIPRNRNGKRTVAQWKQMAKQLGQRIANLSPEQIEDIAVKSYYDLEPTKAITRYDNQSKTNVGYEQLYANDWVNEVYEGVRENRQYSIDTENGTPQASLNDDEDLQAIREHHERELGDTIKLEDIQELPELNQEGKLEGELPKTIDRIVEKRTKEKVTFKEFVKELKKQFVNKGYAVDKLADATKNQKLKYKYDRQLMAFNEAQVSLGDAQVDTNGRVVGKSLNDVFKKADKSGLSKVFADYLENYNNIARDKLGENLYGADVTAVQSRKIVEEYEKKYPQFKEWKEDVSNYNDNLAKTYLVGSFIDDSLWGKLKELNQDYVPAFRDITETKGLADSVDNVGFQVLKRAEGGSSNILTPKEAMAEQTLQYVKAFRKNETIKELYKTVKGQLTDTDIIYEGMETVPDIAYDMMKEAIGKDEDGNYTATFFDNGKATSFKVSKDIFDAFVQSKAIQELENNAITKVIGGTVRNVAQFQRNAVTTYSLPFLLKNMVRDFNDALINTKYSDLRFVKNYAKAYLQLVGKGKLAQQYHNLGGGANTYYEYGKGLLPTNTKNPIKKFMKVVTSMNEVIEQAPRLAEFMSTLETGGSVEEALYNSAEVTTNFKRGGDTAKVINKYGANFFNASIQGADKFIRNITGQKGLKGYASLLVKATIAGVAPSLLNHLLISGSDDDEEKKAYEDLQQYAKENYYLFYKGNGEFFRIPKGRIAGILGNTAVRLYNQTQGEDEVWDNYFNDVILENIAPNNPLTNNIIAPVLQAKGNKAWYGDSIYNESKYANKLPVEVTDEKIDWLSNKVAEGVNAVFDDKTLMKSKNNNGMLDLLANPKKLNYILDQYSGGFGDIIMPLGTPQAESDVFTDQFTTSSVLKNKYINEFYDMLDNNLGKSEYATDFDKLTYKYLDQQSKEIGNLYKEKHEISLDENLSDEEKKEQVYEIQKQINDLAEKTVKTIQDTKVSGNTADFDGTTYYKDNEENWKKVEEDDKISGVSDTTYANYKNKLSVATKKKREAEGNKDVDLTYQEKDKILLNSTYSDKEKDSIYTQTVGKKDDAYKGLKIVANPDIDTYLDYKSQTFEALDDPNSNVVGKKVTKGEGTKKSQTINYIRNSNMSTAEQEYLISTQYKLDSTKALREYIDGLNLSPEDYNTVMSGIASSNVEQLKDGTWRWKK